jgi:hypothetical protein
VSGLTCIAPLVTRPRPDPTPPPLLGSSRTAWSCVIIFSNFPSLTCYPSLLIAPSVDVEPLALPLIKDVGASCGPPAAAAAAPPPDRTSSTDVAASTFIHLLHPYDPKANTTDIHTHTDSTTTSMSFLCVCWSTLIHSCESLLPSFTPFTGRRSCCSDGCTNQSPNDDHLHQLSITIGSV